MLHLIIPSQWKGLGEHDEDILCAAIMKNQPMQMATGSFDGEIVIWNSVTELASKHLTTRKRILKKNHGAITKDVIYMNVYKWSSLYILNSYYI